MAGMDALTSIWVPSVLGILWSVAAPTILAGVLFYFMENALAHHAPPSAQRHMMRWLVLVPAAALLLLGASAAIDAATQALLRDSCLRGGVASCQPATPTLYVGSVLWIAGGVALLCGAALAASGRAQRVFGSKAFAAALTVVLAANLVLGMVAGFLVLQPALSQPAEWIGIRTALLLSVTAGLIWTGVLTYCRFEEGAWAIAARLLGWMNLVPTALVAGLLGLLLLNGATPSDL